MTPGHCLMVWHNRNQSSFDSDFVSKTKNKWVSDFGCFFKTEFRWLLTNFQIPAPTLVLFHLHPLQDLIFFQLLQLEVYYSLHECLLLLSDSIMIAVCVGMILSLATDHIIRCMLKSRQNCNENIAVDCVPASLSLSGICTTTQAWHQPNWKVIRKRSELGQWEQKSNFNYFHISYKNLLILVKAPWVFWCQNFTKFPP
jgi:hypothetical protein